MRELIYGNQSIVAFNLPTFKREQVAACVPELLQLISNGQVKLFAPNQFRLAEVVQAFEALSSRRTIGKVVLIPERTQ
jgi:NADPH:quinone reductase-like Zn-dependent oxidoreductase